MVGRVLPEFSAHTHVCKYMCMPQLAIYLDDDTARLLDEAASEAGLSRSAWVREAIRFRLQEHTMASLLNLYGAWEDDREPADILDDIRGGPPQRPGATFA